jgi:phospholipid/cholesterol/gamma-HCH transport system ATP-binding protein
MTRLPDDRDRQEGGAAAMSRPAAQSAARASTCTETAVRMENVIYDMPSKRVLDGVSLRVECGEIKAVIGMSGSGKTTILRNIMGLVRPTSGEIWVEDVEITRLSENRMDQVRRRMAYVFQGAALFDSLTVFENVAFGPRNHRALPEDELVRLVNRQLELVGMRDAAERTPSELSGGMQKRVGIARALALDPRVILFDEPTAGLDPITSRAIQDLIARLRDELEVSCLVVSHDLEGLFRFVDRAALLYEGRIVASGRPAELRESDDPLVRQFVTGSVQGPIHVV